MGGATTRPTVAAATASIAMSADDRGSDALAIVAAGAWYGPAPA